MWFTAIDQTGAYNQLLVHPEFSKYLVFTLEFGTFKYLRMPQGLSTSPEAFQELMRTLFGHLAFVLIYIDDILIFSKSQEEHIGHLKIVLDIFLENNIRINLKKSVFAVKELKYLGFILKHNGIAPNPAKVESLMEIPPPTNLKQLQCIFLV